MLVFSIFLTVAFLLREAEFSSENYHELSVCEDDKQIDDHCWGETDGDKNKLVCYNTFIGIFDQIDDSRFCVITFVNETLFFLKEKPTTPSCGRHGLIGKSSKNSVLVPALKSYPYDTMYYKTIQDNNIPIIQSPPRSPQSVQEKKPAPVVYDNHITPEMLEKEAREREENNRKSSMHIDNHNTKNRFAEMEQRNEHHSSKNYFCTVLILCLIGIGIMDGILVMNVILEIIWKRDLGIVGFIFKRVFEILSCRCS